MKPPCKGLALMLVIFCTRIVPPGVYSKIRIQSPDLKYSMMIVAKTLIHPKMLQSTKKALPSRIAGAHLDDICYIAKIVVAEFDIEFFRHIVPALKGKCSHVRS